jgi:hypothetical protein
MTSKAKMLKAGMAGASHAKSVPLATLPKPSDADAMAFVEGKRRQGRGGKGPSVQTSRRPDVQNRRDLVERSGGRLMRRMTVYFDPALADRLEGYCGRRLKLSDEIGTAVDAYLRSKGA